ncbi:MAG: DNA starvation/stationary phase protection protein Dps [Gemmataceae bacterium]|nr:DNA starvation/stationary phase protection protein Dps [Gemmata sp.]MDW8199452.1 DNA starvation/stationary phase protection protein Dps [Gemmataceae bacterium]
MNKTTTTAAIPFSTRNDIDAGQRAQLVAILQQSLADLFDLHSQTKFAHWNVKGPNFIALHKLFDELADELAEQVDTLAERITALGGVAHGTVRQVAATSRIPEFPAHTYHAPEVLTALADRFAAVGKTVRAAIDASGQLGDQDTADLFTGLSRDLDKALYFLEAHLQG